MALTRRTFRKSLMAVSGTTLFLLAGCAVSTPTATPTRTVIAAPADVLTPHIAPVASTATPTRTVIAEPADVPPPHIAPIASTATPVPPSPTPWPPIVQKAAPTPGDWRAPISEAFQRTPPRQQTSHFLIWTDPDALDPGELALVAELLERAFDEATSFLRIAYDVAAKGKIPVYFRSAPGIAGFTTTRMAIVFSAYRNVLRAAPGLAMIGEIAHIITGRHEDYMIRHLDAPYLEMKFVGLFAYPGCGFTLHQQAAALIEAGRLVPIADIPADLFEWGFQPGIVETIGDRQQAHRFYTESGSFGQYLMERYGVEALNRLRSRPDRAWLYAYGKPVQDLQQAWLDLLGGVRRQNVALVKRLAQAAQTSDPCLASHRLRRAP